ncbi:MAG: BREX-2 system phosphatase PglZ, partial [Cellulomonas sp.]|nr:BREX-2 system phosphatase PglZ [Cellulomonas sp.]
VLVLRARPRWTGPEELTVGTTRVLVRGVVSQLAALSALAERGPDDYLVLLSDRTEQELGDAVMLRAHKQRVEPVDEWSTVPGLYDAQRLDPALLRAGAWVPAALLEHQPPDGWPRAASGVVTADHALGNLLGAVLRLPLPVDLDLVGLLIALHSPESRAAWQGATESLRDALRVWAADRLGAAAGMALAAAARGPISVVAIGLALDVLWPSTTWDVVDPEQGPARGRIESPARALADASRTQLLRLDLDHDTTVSSVLAQAEALLADLGWAAGAERSTVLPAGLRARLRALAALLAGSDVAAIRAALPRIEGALADVVAHDRAAPDEVGVDAARMAVRLARWVSVHADRALPTELGAALRDYLSDGAWADRAAAIVWNGSTDDVVSAAYRTLLATVRHLRDRDDHNAARLLAPATELDSAPVGAVLIENVLNTVVWPTAASTRPLVILLDGMSAPVAVELAEALSSEAWIERVPDDGKRVAVLAALPTLTRYSRTAFFTGELRDGKQDTEKAVMKARFRAPLFHKDDLRAAAGEVLPSAVRAAIDDPSLRLVSVVLNTIDDALDKHDPGGTRWDLDDIPPLRALLNAAAVAGRTVVLTSDHGHVVERGSEARPVAAAEARHRPVSSGAPGPDEVLVRGRRVVSGEEVLPWREDLRYASLRSGYHGGASLAEITVPFLVFGRLGQADSAVWRDAPPQAPAWWNETQRAAAPGLRRSRRTDTVAGAQVDLAVMATERRTVLAPDGPQGVLAFDLPEQPVRTERGGQNSPPAVVAALVAQLTSSEVYADQRARAGRRALSHEQVAAALTALTEQGGRAHRDTLAAVLDISVGSFGGVFAAIGRLLNVDGYPVISLDADGVTVRLDDVLLREQFELASVRG